jgi:septal ring factor EnvC (AmiA/AmiB activator)
MAAGLDIVGVVGVDVVPVAPNFHTNLKAMVLPAAARVGEDAGKKMGEEISKHIVITLPKAITQGGTAAVRAAGRQGDNAGGAFARSLRAKLEAAFRAMPKLDVKLGDTGVDAQLARIRAKLEQLSNKRIGIDISAEDAEAKVKQLEEELRRLGAAHPNVAVRADTATARASLRALREEIAVLTADPARIRIETDGSFGARLRAAVQAAEASLPNINIDADTSAAEVEIARLRAELTSLRDAKVGIDISSAEALAKIERIQERLARLSASDVDIAVRVDSAAAVAQLTAVRAAADEVQKRNFIHLDTSQASGAALRLAIALGAVIALPAIPPIVAGIGALAAALTAATAGVGVFAAASIPAIKGVTEAIQAKSAAEKEAASATNNSAAAEKRGAQSALQMASAQASLTSARRNAARSVAQANRQVEGAERALGQAAARAMEQREQAAKRVEQAERSLSDAKRSARQAEQDLTQARADAARQLADLNDQLERGRLDERDAALRVQEARAELARTQAEHDAGKASDLQLQRAQLAYDEALQAAKQQQKSFAQLQKDAEAAKKAGVDGNSDVKRAAESLADAQRNVSDQTEAVAEAQRDAAKAQIESAQAVADAQRSLSDAVTHAADAQVQAAESIASAERGVESARLSSIDTTAKAGAQAEAYRKALAKLTPEQRKLFDSIAGPKGLTAAFKAWSKELQPDTLPIFTRAVNGAKASLPGFTPLVRTAADAIGVLMDRASAEIKRPFWQDFKADINDAAKPAIVGLGVAFGNVLKGMAGVVDAFLPHMDGISLTMQRITKRFANWGTNLKGSPEFENFLAYVKANGPRVAEFFGDLFKLALDLSKALAPMSRIAMGVLTPLIKGLDWISIHAPGAIQILWGIYAATKVIALGMHAFNAAMFLYEVAVAGATLVTSGWAAALAATGIVPLITAIVIAVAALAAGVIWAYKNVGWFRTAVDASWKGIRVATDWLWQKALKPFFDGFGAVVTWLWTRIIKPYIGFIIGYWHAVGNVIVWLYSNIVKPYVEFMVGYWLKVADVISWLWTGIFKPIFGFIGALIAWWWTNIVLKYFSHVMGILKDTGAAFSWLYKVGIKPHVDKISEITQGLWKNGIKPAFDKIMEAAAQVGNAFKMAKDAIGKHWRQVAGIAAKPVNFIIEWVYSKGIKAVVDKVGSFVGLDPLPAAPKLLDTNPKLLEAGGTVGDGLGVAAPMKVNRPTAIVGEGNPRYPEYVIPTDPKYRGRALALHQQAGTQLLEDGGILGGVWDYTKGKVGGAVSKGLDLVKLSTSLMAHPASAFSKLMKPMLDRAKQTLSGSTYAEMLGRIPPKLVNSLKSKIVEAFSFSGGGGVGQWMKPVNAPFGTKFGVAGSMWSSGHHTGLDFPAPVGTPVHAVAGGSVTGVGTAGPYGNHVEIAHGGGLSSLYAHMSKILVQLGQNVAGGDTIGKVGATGNVTGPHLHLEARLNGRSVDPMPYLTSIRTGSKVSQGIASAKNFAKSQLRYFGWGPGQFAPLERLWEGESGWRWNAKNPSSGAYGIAQALPASKMASAGPDWRTNPATQILWGLDYIKDRPDYGSPAAAFSKWMSRNPHWYDDGGYLPPGLSLVANGTGSPEPVFTSDQWSTLRDARAGGGPTEIHADVRVFVGDREITDIVRTEINTYDAQVATDLNNGRWG